MLKRKELIPVALLAVSFLLIGCESTEKSTPTVTPTPVRPPAATRIPSNTPLPVRPSNLSIPATATPETAFCLQGPFGLVCNAPRIGQVSNCLVPESSLWVTKDIREQLQKGNTRRGIYAIGGSVSQGADGLRRTCNPRTGLWDK